MSRNINRLITQIIRQPPAPLCISLRLYARWSHRSPAKVLLPYKENPNLKTEKIIDLDSSIIKKTPRKESVQNVENVDRKQPEQAEQPELRKQSTLPPEKSAQIKQKREESLKKRKFYLSQQKVFDDKGDIIYEKLKDNDGRVSTLLVKLKSKKERLRSGQTLVEGWRLITDGLEAKCKLKYVIFSRTEELSKLKPFLPKTGVIFYKVSYKEMQLWSDVETSPGIFGIFETPTPDNVKTLSKPLPLHFICDNIRVPGNLGAILRVAVGAGCEKVLLSKGCVDVWDPKVIRSAAGAHFRLPIYHSLDWNEMPTHLEKNTSIFVADSNTTSTSDGDSEELENFERNQLPVLPYYGVDFSTLQHTTLIIGGETEGISQDSYKLATTKNGVRLNIPLQRGVDSLNTGMATAVIAFEIRKQLIQNWTKEKLARQMSQSN
ncbi:rRNA methyltransferase 3, mitochondrial [Spodoptera frugiperda]|uniref:rRNA methyltransferase 3, mitochondrial n=1 Tax=Spodoptera frugiperda TaxID=7108 RepID=A0A9R0EII2_SPOFR|nr:rRNA methyltransferase 3, mitochondrial [Spodoptera frugiperda]